MITFVPGSVRSANASIFFSTATRPTFRKIGRAIPANGSPGWPASTRFSGVKASVSTPRLQATRFEKP